MRLPGRLICLLAASGLTSAAAAETCLSSTLDRPFPGATGVETLFADVPSARYPGVWQQGRLAGYDYRIWSNNEAVLEPSGAEPDWSISVRCPDEGECRIEPVGAPPEDARNAAEQILTCLQDPSWTGYVPEPEPEPAVTEEPLANPEPAAEVAEEPAPEAAEPAPPEPEPAPCGLAKVGDGPAGLLLQKLIVEAGADPGPLDGIPGGLTRAALVEVLGDDAAGLDEADAIAALDAFLCAPSEASQPQGSAGQ